MSKLKLSLLLAGLLALIAAPGAQAAVITLDSVTQSWSNTVGGVDVVENVAGPDGFNDVRWGTDGPIGQSGLGFLGVTPGFPIIIGTDFLIGDLRHYNRPINGAASATEMSLFIGMTVDGTPISEGPFNFNMLIDETLNEEPCAYPSIVPCADRITFVKLLTSDTFVIDGITYTLTLTGFSSDGGVTISPNFISDEGTDNTIALYGRITAASDIPEPSTMALFGLGLAALGVLRKRVSAR
jgi:hypothetical protein